MKFLADMGISPLTVEWLAEKGHDAVHLLDLDASQTRDSEILRRARDESRVLLTHALDFSELVAASQGPSPASLSFGYGT